MTLTELTKKLREADIYESQPDQSGNNIGRYVATDLPHDVADRLEAIEKAWRRYDDDPNQSFDAEQEAYDALRHAIEGTEP